MILRSDAYCLQGQEHREPPRPQERRQEGRLERRKDEEGRRGSRGEGKEKRKEEGDSSAVVRSRLTGPQEQQCRQPPWALTKRSELF